MNNRYCFISIVFVSFLACQSKSQDLPVQKLFDDGASKGTVNATKLGEASGMVEGMNNPNMFWTHNDSGNAAELFLIDKAGKIQTTIHLPTLKNRDWEEVAVGSENGKNYIYIGEIGDNKAQYEFKYLYRIEEPVLSSTITDTTITKVDSIKFNLSDGIRDTEAFIIDPLTNEVYIFSKREPNVNLYKFSLPTVVNPTAALSAKRVLEKMPFTLVVAADISVDGTEILIKNYDNIYYWKRETTESVEEALKRSPVVLPYTPEPQGESIAFDRAGTGYYTLSEQKKKKPQHLYFYKRK